MQGDLREKAASCAGKLTGKSIYCTIIVECKGCKNGDNRRQNGIYCRIKD